MALTHKHFTLLIVPHNVIDPVPVVCHVGEDIGVASLGAARPETCNPHEDIRPIPIQLTLKAASRVAYTCAAFSIHISGAQMLALM
jgi:hypothetical protein